MPKAVANFWLAILLLLIALFVALDPANMFSDLVVLKRITGGIVFVSLLLALFESAVRAIREGGTGASLDSVDLGLSWFYAALAVVFVVVLAYAAWKTDTWLSVGASLGFGLLVYVFIIRRAIVNITRA